MSRYTSEHSKFAKIYNIFGIYLVAFLFCLIGFFVSPQFATASNFLDILYGISILGIVATGMAFITYSGNMADLSIPSIMAFAGIITVASLPLGLVPALILGVFAGMMIGALNGLVIGSLNANPILWTLAVSFFMEGFMRFAWSNNQVYPDTAQGTAGAAFIQIFRTHLFGFIPSVVVVMILMFFAGYFIMTKTRIGIETKLVGASRDVAKISGINVRKVILFDFIIAAFAASVAGIYIASMTKLGVFYLGKGYDFKAVTAVVIGGIMLSGGKGSMPGVFGGVLVIGLMSNIMTFLGVGLMTQNIVTGTIFILVVGIHQFQLRRQGKAAE